jgi:hypothetical protein
LKIRKIKTRESLVVGFALLVVFGLSLNFNYYQSTIKPLNLSQDYLGDVVSSSDPIFIHTHLIETKFILAEIARDLPENKNPVWVFPTETTNFQRIEGDVDFMITLITKISTVPKDSSVYHTGMLDINARSMVLKENLDDAKGFLYFSGTNVFFTIMWLIGSIGFTKMWMESKI